MRAYPVTYGSSGMRRLAALCLAAVALGACTSTAAPATTTVPTTPIPSTTLQLPLPTTGASGTTTTITTTAVLAARFLHIVAPFDKALSASEAEMPRMTRVNQLYSLEGPIETFSNALTRIGLGGRALYDAQSLVSRLSLMHADLVTNVSRATLQRDLSTMYAADDKLRADLGLPAAK